MLRKYLGAGRNSTPIIILQQNFNCKKFKQTTYSIATALRSFLRTTTITAVKWKIYTQSVETSYAGGKNPPPEFIIISSTSMIRATNYLLAR